MNSRDLLPTADRAGPTALLPVGPATHCRPNKRQPGEGDLCSKTPCLLELHSRHGGIQARTTVRLRAREQTHDAGHEVVTAGETAPILWTYFKARHNEPWRAV